PPTPPSGCAQRSKNRTTAAAAAASIFAALPSKSSPCRLQYATHGRLQSSDGWHPPRPSSAESRKRECASKESCSDGGQDVTAAASASSSDSSADASPLPLDSPPKKRRA